jgi:hypothetical protein
VLLVITNVKPVLMIRSVVSVSYILIDNRNQRRAARARMDITKLIMIQYVKNVQINVIIVKT